jgi:hypothetical protein
MTTEQHEGGQTMTTDAAQQALATKVQRFMKDLTSEEATLFAASIAGGLWPGAGVEGDTIDVKGFGLLPLARSPGSPIALASAPPKLEARCRWQAEGPGTLCYYCGSVRVQCVNFG